MGVDLNAGHRHFKVFVKGFFSRKQKPSHSFSSAIHWLTAFQMFHNLICNIDCKNHYGYNHAYFENAHTNSSHKSRANQPISQPRFVQVLFYLLIVTYSPVNRSGSFHKSNFAHKLNTNYNTKHAYCINVKHTNIVRKVVPLVSLS